MTAQAFVIVVVGGVTVLTLVVGMWLRLYRRNRTMPTTNLGKSTMHEIKSRE